MQIKSEFDNMDFILVKYTVKNDNTNPFFIYFL